MGLMTQTGISPVSQHFDSARPFAKTPHDLAALLDVIGNPEVKSEKSRVLYLTGVRGQIGVAALDLYHLRVNHCADGRIGQATND